MKVCFFLLILVSSSLSAPGVHQKRNLLMDALMRLFNVQHVKLLVQDLLDEMGSDEHEHTCEFDCHKLVEENFHATSFGRIGHSGCPLVCHSFQELVHFFNLKIPVTTIGPGSTPSSTK